MNEYSLKDILEEVHVMEFSQYDNSLKHRFSLRHRRNMKRILALEYAEPQYSGKLKLNRRTACVIAVVVFLAVVSITAVAGVVSFIVKKHSDNTELFATNFEGCPDTIEDFYYLSGISENYVLQESNITVLIAADYLYLDSQTGKKIVFEQYVKCLYNQHFDNQHNNDLVSIDFDGHEAYYKGTDRYSVFVWDNGDYIFSISGNLTKTEIIDLARTLKIKNE